MIRYVYYVGIKYQELSAKEILKKAKSITKDNVLRIFGYTLLFEIILLVVSFPLLIIITFLSLNMVMYLTIGFVLNVLVTTVINVLTALFTMTLYKALDEERNSDLESLDMAKEN